MTAETVMLIGGAAAFALTVHWVRARDLREKYALGWLAVATAMLLLGLFPEALKQIAEYAHLSYAAAALVLVLAAVYMFAFAVSVALTNQYRRNVRLTQELAMLEERVRELERTTRERGAA